MADLSSECIKDFPRSWRGARSPGPEFLRLISPGNRAPHSRKLGGGGQERGGGSTAKIRLQPPAQLCDSCTTAVHCVKGGIKPLCYHRGTEILNCLLDSRTVGQINN